MTTTFLILSDTHDDAFPDSSTMPKVDVVLHCGDLTMIGGLGNYQRAIAKLQAIDAELKLVIAGNHDVSLDQKWWQANLDEDDEIDEPEKARALFTAAQEAYHIYLLDEGVHSFTLSGGRHFTIYTSPYTPEFNGYAWSYEAGENRFNADAEKPIPISGVDIVMTHGPPMPPSSTVEYYKLDVNRGGKHCGCPMLFEAIRLAKPRLHCFGHIHEGYGAQEICWTETSDRFQPVSSDDAQQLISEAGKTLFVNAAIMNHGGRENNRPWVVSMDLPRKERQNMEGREPCIREA